MTEQQKVLLEALKHLKIQEEMIISIMLMVQESNQTMELLKYLGSRMKQNEEMKAEEIFQKAIEIICKKG